MPNSQDLDISPEALDRQEPVYLGASNEAR